MSFDRTQHGMRAVAGMHALVIAHQFRAAGLGFDGEDGVEKPGDAGPALLLGAG
ncbi:hypothetical protein JI664_06370 [Rhodobacter sp. NTK016B]|uniref:hypothetical protein n=1 Tax=Rhodobacter sp. NTK016B TaxID=2759676 RepID=UPI001A8E54BC|nr:hypothetical protein [Rhodobacter sp. NTK016B]MBN8291580.1 hypothetical protein [Rhodobacter sp. NTK016B]